jgi:divalent metal cation (Fe/Co/Zn/Cd) transporter
MENVKNLLTVAVIGALAGFTGGIYFSAKKAPTVTEEKIEEKKEEVKKTTEKTAKVKTVKKTETKKSGDVVVTETVTRTAKEAVGESTKKEEKVVEKIVEKRAKYSVGVERDIKGVTWRLNGAARLGDSPFHATFGVSPQTRDASVGVRVDF